MATSKDTSCLDFELERRKTSSGEEFGTVLFMTSPLSDDESDSERKSPVSSRTLHPCKPNSTKYDFACSKGEVLDAWKQSEITRWTPLYLHIRTKRGKQGRECEALEKIDPQHLFRKKNLVTEIRTDGTTPGCCDEEEEKDKSEQWYKRIGIESNKAAGPGSSTWIQSHENKPQKLWVAHCCRYMMHPKPDLYSTKVSSTT